MKPWSHVFALAALVPSASILADAATQPATRPAYEIGRFTDPAVSESSGIVPSRRNPGIFWTHNDSGNEPILFAVTREGKLVHQVRVGVPNVDWEDVALDEAGKLYIGDIGNNGGHRTEIAVHQLDEPDSAPGPFKFTKPIRPTATWRLRYPAKAFDCESLFIFKGRGYLISKAFPGFPAELYRFDLKPTEKPVTLEHVATLPIHSSATAADVSPDGKLLAVMTIGGPYLLRIDGHPLAAAKAKPAHVQHFNLNMEGVCFVDEGLLATTEGRQVLLFRWNDFDQDVREGPTSKRP